MEDSVIIELYFIRDEDALLKTEEKYGKLCHKVAYNILNNREDAEECVNDTYKEMWNSIPPKKPDNLTAFICGITRNLSLKRLEYLKRDKRAKHLTESFDELEEILSSNTEGSISEENIGKLISDFLRGRGRDERNVFIRKYYFFDSVEEIAARYSFTESKVKNMLYRTRQRLKEYLIKEGIEL